MKQFISLTLAVCLLVGLLTACGSAASTQPPQTEAPPAAAAGGKAETPPAADETEADIYAPYAGTELTFIRHSGYEADWMSEKAEEFYQLSGIKVTVEQIAYSEMKNKVLLDISSSSGAYDMIATTEYWLSEYNEGGWLVDMNQFIHDPTLLDADFELEDIGQSTLDANTVDGQLLAMPWKFNSQLLAYRTDILDAAPSTWEDYLAAAEACTSDGMSGVSLALSINSVMDIYLNLLYQAGGTFLSDDNTVCNLDTPEAKEALDFLLELSKFTTAGATSNQWPESSAVFAQGNAAMYPLINSQISNLLASAIPEVSGNIGYAELPGQVACLTTWGVAITSNCKCPQAAWLFIQYMLNPENTRDLVIGTEGADIPVRSSLLLSDEFISAYPHFATMNTITQSEGHTWVYPKTTCTTAIMEALAIHIQNAILGTETPENALSSAKTEIEQLLNA